MKIDFMELLYENKIMHAYVIKAVEGKLKNFELRKGPIEPLTYGAIWHEENIVTLTGNYAWCKELFDQYYGTYNFYDLAPDLMEKLKREDGPYLHERHHLMKLSARRFETWIKSYTRSGEGLIIKPLKEVKQARRYQLLEEGGRVLGSVLIEKATDNVVIISEFIIRKPYRKNGLATYFVTRLIEQIAGLSPEDGPEIILYVDEDNTAARKLYDKVGFETLGMFENLVIDE